MRPGKVQEFRAELLDDRKDPKHTTKRIVLKKIVANMTIGNDMSPLFPDVHPPPYPGVNAGYGMHANQ
jgi:hypothetical protein